MAGGRWWCENFNEKASGQEKTNINRLRSVGLNMRKKVSVAQTGWELDGRLWPNKPQFFILIGVRKSRGGRRDDDLVT